MAALQVGDIIALTKLALQLWEWGWNERLSCSRQYADFGQDVLSLHESLLNLGSVIDNADNRLQHLSFHRNARSRYDARSLYQIIGDCQRTLNECFDLLQSNKRFAPRGGAVKSIEWNVLVQGHVDALQQRIKQHITKIHLALAPFEVDLLSRIHEDLHDIHKDLAHRIDRLHEDVSRIPGIIVPDLQQRLAQQVSGKSYTIQVPLDIKSAFEAAYGQLASPSLSDISDVWVSFYYQSTVSYKPPTLLARDKVPPDEQYVNLLKCVWLMQMIKDLDEFRDERKKTESHWPSYVAELENILSEECRRFDRELLNPQRPCLAPELVSIWPTKKETNILDEIQKEEMIEKVLDSKIKHASEDRMLDLQLLRRLDPGGGSNEFRIIVSGVQQSRGDNLDPIDFNLRTSVLIPHYAVDMNPPFDIILETGLRMTSLHFTQLKEAMKFQHATTGYRVLDYKQFHVDCKFVFSSQREAVPTHKACAQIWVPYSVQGKLSTTAESRRDQELSSRSTSISSTTLLESIPRARFATPPTFSDPFPPSSRRESTRQSFIEGSRQSQLSTNSCHLSPISDEPLQHSSLNGSRQGLGFDGRMSAPNACSPSSYGDFGGYRSPCLSSSPPTDEPLHLGGSPGAKRRQFSQPSSGGSFLFDPNPRASIVSQNSSSSGSQHTTTIATGNGTGVLHVPPAKPMLVLLTQDTRTGLRTMVTLDLTSTDVNPERCNCRRSDARGRDCCDVSLEKTGNGGRPMDARKLEPLSAAQPDWDFSRLASSRQNEEAFKKSQWKDLTRVTLTFMNPQDKARFTGGGCPCPNRGKRETAVQRRSCVTAGHRGLVGEAKEYYHDESVKYMTWRNGRQHVVNGIKPDDAPM